MVRNDRFNAEADSRVASDSLEIRGLIEFRMILDFLLCENMEGRLTDFRKVFTTNVSDNTKFQFLNSMVTFGVLYPVGKWRYGKEIRNTYKIDQKLLYKMFKNNEIGRLSYEVFNNHHFLTVE